jgi:hypothetical protein
MIEASSMPNCELKPVPAITLLNDWLKKKRVSVPKFAKLIHRDPQIVHAWRYLRARPLLVDILIIEVVTGIPARKWLDNTQRDKLSLVKREVERAA